MLDVRRADIGVWMSSADSNILLTPVLAYPTQPESLSVNVCARSAPDGEFPGQTLHQDKQRGFRFEEISVNATRLDCWHPHEFASSRHSAFLKGFCLELEPDVIAALRTWLVPLRRVSRVACAIAKEIEGSSGRVPTRDNQARIGRIVSARVFGGCTTEWSVVVGQGWAPRLEIQLKNPAVPASLATCGTDFHTLAKEFDNPRR